MATTQGLTKADIDTAEWHSARLDGEVSNLLTTNAIDVIGWQDQTSLLVIEQPTASDLNRRQPWGVRFWLVRFALAARLGIDPEARKSAAAARAWGARWADVGEVIAMTRQGAQQRYGSTSGMQKPLKPFQAPERSERPKTTSGRTVEEILAER